MEKLNDIIKAFRVSQRTKETILRMADFEEIEIQQICRKIINKAPGVKVLALSMHNDIRFVAEMLNAGASGYLLKDCAFEELIHAIRVVAEQGSYVSPKINIPSDCQQTVAGRCNVR